MSDTEEVTERFNGPWQITWEEDRARVLYVVTDADGTEIADVVGDSAEAEANAHLIAAAPQMYEALKKMLSANKNMPLWELGAIKALAESALSAAAPNGGGR